MKACVTTEMVTMRTFTIYYMKTSAQVQRVKYAGNISNKLTISYHGYKHN